MAKEDCVLCSTQQATIVIPEAVAHVMLFLSFTLFSKAAFVVACWELRGYDCEASVSPFCTLQFSLPESPRWLLLSGASRDKALDALVRAEGKRAENAAVAQAEIDAMEASVREAQQYNAERQKQRQGANEEGNADEGVFGALGELFTNRRYYRPLLVGMSLMLFQQVGGWLQLALAVASCLFASQRCITKPCSLSPYSPLL